MLQVYITCVATLFLCKNVILNQFESNFEKSWNEFGMEFVPRQDVSQRFFSSPAFNLGPNKCQGGYECCPGWSLNPSTRLCTVPTCRNPCGFGICRSPNLCQCLTGGFGSVCNNVGNDQSECQGRCMNGGKCENEQCVCKPGYVGLNCEQPICEQPCLNNGRCIGPSRCACPYGYAGFRCEEDYRVGPCFTRVEDNMCKGQLVAVKCTQESCCATVGAAWGVPCSKCPEKRDCSKGFFKDPRTGKCADINECRGIPNICAMGTCINTDGSYHCECGTGRKYNSQNFECSDIDECSLSSGLCEFGKCVNIDGSFKCICNPGYKAVLDGKRCVSDETAVSNQCFSKFNNGQCSLLLFNQTSKKECCCGNPQRAFGLCNVCPSKGQEAYRALGCADDEGIIGSIGDGRDEIADGEEIDICESNKRLCEFGRCEKHQNSFKCICNIGYIAVNNGKRCQVIDAFDTCYMEFNDGKCVTPSPNQSSKRECCCSNRKQAFGFCNQCPEKGTAEYRSLVCEDDGGIIGQGDEQTEITENENICKVKKDLCKFGKCEKVGLSFQCKCNDGYRSSDNGKKCVAVEKYAVCYQNFDNGKCTVASKREVSQRQCCCGNPGRAFEFCKQCPAKGDDAYKELGCSDDNIFEDKDEDKLPGDKNNGNTNSVDINIGFDSSNNSSSTTNINNGFEVNNETYLVGNGEDGDTQCEDIFLSNCDNGKCETMNGKYKCFCKYGYEKNKNNYCADLNECKKYDGLCHGGTCENTPGSFKCKCPEGHVQSPDGFACMDVNECENSSTCINGVCKNFLGTFQCRCNEGYESGSTVNICVDRNECLTPGVCPGESKCINTNGSYICQCKEGYYAQSDTTCVDIDECRIIENLCSGGHCINIGGSFKCICPAGYELSADGKSCKDRDECSYLPDVCSGGQCVNGPGSYRCSCNFGFRVSESGTSCIETRIDKCFASYNGLQCSKPLLNELTRVKCCCGMENTGIRAWGANCESCPKKGSAYYEKLCLHGSGLDDDGKDIDECKNNAGLSIGICDHGNCSNLMRDYKCICQNGFTNSIDSNKVCEDIDECLESNICKGGKCTNTLGSFKCVCPTGYQFIKETKVCEDEDECLANPCLGGKCINLGGSFRCECPPGSYYDEKRRLCKDNREGNCYVYNDVESKCEKIIGSFLSKSECCNGLGSAWGNDCEKCDSDSSYGCKKGYKRVGAQCIDIDECKFSSACYNGRCVNYEGSYRCICPTGYKLEGNLCKDMRTGVCYRSIAEGQCSMALADAVFKKSNCCCSAFSRAWGSPCEICPLKNTWEHKELCPKGEGFDENGEDLNECNMADICQNGQCINTQGSYRCVCNSGFDVDATGSICVDVNECVISKGICGPGECVNTIGSFRCSCHEGFRNDFMLEKCIDINECLEGNPSPCQSGKCINTPGSFQCDCPSGLKTTGASSACEDINECEEVGICQNGVCQNFIGGYQCSCLTGFNSSADMLQCHDVDECSKNNGGCEFLCSNTPGSFQCGCQPGFELLDNKRTCADIDECERGTPCGEVNTCTNIVGGHVCTCSTGYRASLDTKSCIDIDECTEGENICQNGNCINTLGSFLCSCQLGYKLELNAMSCIDIDECSLQENGGCHFDAQCVNNVGSYSCQCKTGYDGDGYTCTDINECALNLATCAQDAMCVNTIGSFSCQCKEGFIGDGEVCLDINECERNQSLCTPGTCVNIVGAYKCECRDGFQATKDAKQCQDKNECLENENLCEHGSCVNTVGSYLCNCASGFQSEETKTKCIDINECELKKVCSNGICKNMLGMYKCICEEAKGFMPNKNETACLDMRLGYCYTKHTTSCGDSQLSPNRMAKQYCCCSAPDGSAWQDDSNESCEDCPLMNSDEYKLLCPGGPSTHVNETSGLIENHDGCTFLTNYCKGGSCNNDIDEGISCQCPEFTQFNQKDLLCEDINECLTPGICGFNAKCVNLERGYQCECQKGTVFDKEQNFCHDFRNTSCFLPNVNFNNQCTNPLPVEVSIGQCCCSTSGNRYGSDCNACPKEGTGEREALCVQKPSIGPVITGQPPIGSIKPTTSLTTMKTYPGTEFVNTGAPAGGIGDTVTVVSGTNKPNVTINPKYDIDECKFYPDICGQGTCVNSIGAFQCNCNEGFKEEKVNYINKCVDVNECLTNPCIDGICNNIDGAFFCSCKEGMTLDETNLKCIDLDECKTAGYCENGKCVNLPRGEGFLCECVKGFTKTSDNKTCKDVDECSLPGICIHGKCNNKPGSYVCECDQGFRTNITKECADINECLEYPDLCSHGHCINLFGSFMCECNKGFQQDLTKQSCPDINECQLSGYCENGYCKNTIGSASCDCNPGFEKNINLTTCEDMNECEDPDNPCQVGGTCVNIVGAFRCLCNTGFVSDVDNRQCIDMRKGFCFSSLKNNQCIFSNELNITKSTCCCAMGAGWGETCEPCPDKGSKEFEYYCPNGVGLERNSTDINECEANLGKCTNGRCVNTDGSFRCDCDKGFVLSTSDPTKCEDQNECTDGSTPCGDGICLNLVGSYSCECQKGFRSQSLDNPSCVDINECEETNDTCSFRCVNVPGSYQCVCPRGFTLADDKKHCEDINECLNPNICPYRCKNIVGGYRCMCLEGYETDRLERCIEIDECQLDKTLCQPGGICQNIEGSYRCDCIPPFKRSFDGKHCEDKSMGLCFSNVADEMCQGSTKMTKVSQRDCCCTGGGFAWGSDCRKCPSYNSAAGKSLCNGNKNRTINECEFIVGVCTNGKCMDMPDGFRCMCNSGFRLTSDGKMCEDIDECAEGSNKCKGVCENTEGGYKCICPNGFKVDSDKFTCVDEDECALGKHNCQHKCENTEGGYKCVCNAGYLMEGNNCVDIDECKETGVCGFATCKNTVGSFDCGCTRGLKYDKEKKLCVYITDVAPDVLNTPGCGQPMCGCPFGYYPYYNANGGYQCVDINECKQNMCGSSSCQNKLGSYSCSCPAGSTFQGGRCQDENECSGQSPCSFGCSNNRGGFSCQCPPGYSPVAGGHCVATHGTVCFTCDTSDIPPEGVPLGGLPEQDSSVGYQPAVGLGQVPLVGGSSSKFASLDRGYSPVGEALAESQYFPRYKQPKYMPSYAKTIDSSYQMNSKPSQQNTRIQASRLNPYQQAYQTANRQLSKSQEQSNFGASQNKFQNYGRSYRSRRSTHELSKPIDITVSRKIPPKSPILNIVSMLKAMNGHMNYEIKSGNSSLFILALDSNGGVFLNTTKILSPGVYRLAISTESKDSNEQQEEFPQSLMRVRVKVL